MKLTERQLRRIIKEAILVESTQNLPWFIQEFIRDFGVYFDNTVVADPKNIKRFKVQFMGGSYYGGYKFTKIRVVFTGTVITWDNDLNPDSAFQMIYSLPHRGYLPSKKTKSKKKIQMSIDLYDEYKAQCDALGIEVLAPNNRTYSRARFPVSY